MASSSQTVMLIDYDISLDVGTDELCVVIPKNSSLPVNDVRFELYIREHGVTTVRMYRGLVVAKAACELLTEFVFDNILPGTLIDLRVNISPVGIMTIEANHLCWSADIKNASFSFLLEQAAPYLPNDMQHRHRQLARATFQEYVETAKMTISDPVVYAFFPRKVAEFIVGKLDWACQIVDFPDVTGDEYDQALQEIRYTIEPHFDEFKKGALKERRDERRWEEIRSMSQD
jgi:hypothetical protein